MKLLASIVITMVALVAATAACTPALAVRPDSMPTPTPTPTPRPVWQGDDNAEALLAYLEGWRDRSKVFLDEDTLVWFMPNHRMTAVEWCSAALVYHLPSMSSVAIGYDGNVGMCCFGWSPGLRYKSEDGAARLESVTADEEVMHLIRGRIAEIQGGLRPASGDGCRTTVVFEADEPP